MPATLVIGYDGSACAKAALDRTVELARLMNGVTVVVVYSFEFSVGYVPAGLAESPLLMSAEYDDHLQLLRDYGEQQVASAAEALTGAGVKVETQVLEGGPVETLLGVAEDHEAVLIVVGSHGEGAVSAAFLGSTALKLLHHSAVPVLVVPSRKHD
jgi:nucleotide-binding universal stress UspA family protein